MVLLLTLIFRQKNRGQSSRGTPPDFLSINLFESNLIKIINLQNFFMKNYILKIPGFTPQVIECESYDEADNKAKNILKKSSFRFIYLLHENKLLSIFIKPGFLPFNFKAFKHFEQNGMINDYFIIKDTETEHEQFYIKLKK